MPFSKPRLALAASLLALLPAAVHAQAEEEFVLRTGQRIPADAVKPSGTGFTATIVTGAAAQKKDFKASEVEEAILREPAELAEARTQIATDKFLAAIAALTRIEEELLHYREVPGAWWHRARILRMDALASKGDNKAAAKLADAKELEGLPPSSVTMLNDFKAIVAPAESPDAKISALKALAKSSTDPWISARAWLEVGNTNAAHGKMDEAIKAWLRVAVFNPAERDLAVRGTIYAARGMQQIGRPQDGVKLLKDYLEDHVASPYAPAIQSETSKLEPKKTDAAAPAPEKAPEKAPEEASKENSN
jgi:tetratricopeptide (TPR) repeat protein